MPKLAVGFYLGALGLCALIGWHFEVRAWVRHRAGLHTSTSLAAPEFVWRQGLARWIDSRRARESRCADATSDLRRLGYFACEAARAGEIRGQEIRTTGKCAFESRRGLPLPCSVTETPTASFDQTAYRRIYDAYRKVTAGLPSSADR